MIEKLSKTQSYAQLRVTTRLALPVKSVKVLHIDLWLKQAIQSCKSFAQCKIENMLW